MIFDKAPKDFNEYISCLVQPQDDVAAAIWSCPEVNSAVKLMEDAHKGVCRKYSCRPYSTHPWRVASFLCRHEVASIALVKAGACHDILEDCPEWNYERLVEKIGKIAADIVVEVTNVKYKTVEERNKIVASFEREKEQAAAARDYNLAADFLALEIEARESIAYSNRAEKKELDRRRLSKISVPAKILKLFDRLDNIYEIDPLSDFAKKYAEETLLLTKVVGDADVSLATLIDKRCEQLLS